MRQRGTAFGPPAHVSAAPLDAVAEARFYPAIEVSQLPENGKLGGGAGMKDYQASLEKLRTDAVEAALIRDLATDQTKREMFDRLHQHLKRLADEIEQAMNAAKQT
jgi:hypothetical protein